MAESDSANSTKDVNRERRFIIVCVFVCLFVYAGVSPANFKILNCQINL